MYDVSAQGVDECMINVHYYCYLLCLVLLALQPEWKIADPICTFLFSVFVLITTFTIVRDIFIVLMEGGSCQWIDGGWGGGLTACHFSYRHRDGFFHCLSFSL